MPTWDLLALVRSVIRRRGWDLVPFDVAQHPLPRRAKLLAHCGIDLVVDIGANVGQFGRELRSLGYRGRIVSFEPSAAAFAGLRRAARGDALWQVHRVALGDTPGQQNLFLSANSESSSLLPMLPLHLESAPQSVVTGEEAVAVDTLDALFDGLAAGARHVFAKIDTQGYEAQVLRGATASLPRIELLQVEMSLAALYEGQTLIGDLMASLQASGFDLVGLESNFGDPRTGQLLQVDGIFRRVRPVAAPPALMATRGSAP